MIYSFYHINGLMIKYETHIVILWPSLVSKKTEVKEYLKSQFEIKNEYYLEISNKDIDWLSNFYGRSLVYLSKEERERIIYSKLSSVGCGIGIVFEIMKIKKNYGIVKTTSGIRYINLEALNIKKRLRAKFSCDIHVSDSLEDYEENKYFINSKNNIESNIRDNSLNDFFKFLDQKNIKYIILRGDKFLEDNNFSVFYNHVKDIDLLISNDDMNKVLKYPYLTKNIYDKEERFFLTIFINQKYYSCCLDLFFSAKGLFPYEFEKQLLIGSDYINGLRKINKKLSDLTQLYSAVFHKRYISKEDMWIDNKYQKFYNFNIDEILKYLEEKELNVVYENPYYPNWSSFPGILKLDRTPILRRLQTKYKDLYYYSYVFDEGNGTISKEGNNKNIEREYLILKSLYRVIPDNIPKPIFFKEIKSDRMGIIIMNKLNGLNFSEYVDYKLGFSKFQNLFINALNCISYFKKLGIQHRDINSSNLFVCNDKICFIDFGWGVCPNYELPKTPNALNLNNRYMNKHDDLLSLILAFKNQIKIPFYYKLFFQTSLNYDIDEILKYYKNLKRIEKIFYIIFFKFSFFRKIVFYIQNVKKKIVKYD